MEEKMGARASNHDHEDALVKDLQDRLLPIANVGRIMKQILPPNAKVSKEAKETMQECASEFISFVTSEASDKCRKERRKTVNGDDVCWALRTLGFDNFDHPLRRYLLRYREFEGDRSNNQDFHKEKDDQPSSSRNTHQTTNHQDDLDAAHFLKFDANERNIM